MVVIYIKGNGQTMSKQGIEQAEVIRHSLTCLKCDYSLRGLPGYIVTCPECGERTNIAAVMMQQWTGPWYLAPLYNLLIIPLLWSLFVLVVGVIGMTVNQGKQIRLQVVMLIIFACAGIWFALIFAVKKKFGCSEGAFLALYIHIIFAGYVVGLVGFVASLIRLVNAIANQSWLTDLITNAVLLCACIGIFYIARVGERFIAARCIRQHVRRIGQV